MLAVVLINTFSDFSVTLWPRSYWFHYILDIYHINTFSATWPTGKSWFFLKIFQKIFVKIPQVQLDFLEYFENSTSRKVTKCYKAKITFLIQSSKARTVDLSIERFELSYLFLKENILRLKFFIIWIQFLSVLFIFLLNTGFDKKIHVQIHSKTSGCKKITLIQTPFF